jgi:hypothetical protein
VYARQHGSQIVPDEDAVRVREVKEVVDAAEGNEKGAPKRPRRTAARQEPGRV